MNNRVALITGVNGQDGAYLARELLNDGYRIVGVVREDKPADTWRLGYLGILEDIKIVKCNQLNLQSCKTLLQQYNPGELYHLAAESSVSSSFARPIETLHFNIVSTLNWLEAIKTTDHSIRFYQASSSEMYGMVTKLPIANETPFHPLSPYAISKASCHWTVNNYRESYGIFASCGILFNHESYLRPGNFFVKKVIRSAIDISEKRSEYLYVGNIDIKRDFGFAPEYVKAIKLILRHHQPDNFQVCSGTSVELRRIIYHVFDRLNLDPGRIRQDSSLYRPTELLDMYGDNSHTKTMLGWHYDLDFYTVLDILINEEIRNQ